MTPYCVMVKGPCRGKSCDFWARIKIRKTSTDEFVVKIGEALENCHVKNASQLTNPIHEYWMQLGIRNLQRLQEEEPDLWVKMKQIESLVKKLMHLSSVKE